MQTLNPLTTRKKHPAAVRRPAQLFVAPWQGVATQLISYRFDYDFFHPLPSYAMNQPLGMLGLWQTLTINSSFPRGCPASSVSVPPPGLFTPPPNSSAVSDGLKKRGKGDPPKGLPFISMWSYRAKKRTLIGGMEFGEGYTVCKACNNKRSTGHSMEHSRTSTEATEGTLGQYKIQRNSRLGQYYCSQYRKWALQRLSTLPRSSAGVHKPASERLCDKLRGHS